MVVHFEITPKIYGKKTICKQTERGALKLLNCPNDEPSLNFKFPLTLIVISYKLA